MKVIVVQHEWYPGAFHFPGQISLEDFLEDRGCLWKGKQTIEFHVFNSTIALTVDECVITEYEQVKEPFKHYEPLWGAY